MKRWRRMAKHSNERLGQKHTGRINKYVHEMKPQLHTLGKRVLTPLTGLYESTAVRYKGRSSNTKEALCSLE